MDEYNANLKRKRNKLNYKEKQEIIKTFEKSGLSTYEFANKTNINPKTLQNWIRNKDKIISINGKQKNLIKIGCGTHTKIPHCIELEILDWFTNIRSMGFPISDELLKTKCMNTVKDHKLNINCNFSNGWLEKFKKRNNICTRKGSSKKIRVDNNKMQIITSFLDRIKKKF